MAVWVMEEEKASEKRQRKSEADKIEVAPWVIVAGLRRFRASLVGTTQGPPKRR